jgi:D-alanyl-lipoteichoic acid acyltransferase DltB (MBOAT superfamily)
MDLVPRPISEWTNRLQQPSSQQERNQQDAENPIDVKPFNCESAALSPAGQSASLPVVNAMLFNSYEFLFVFLPLVFLGFLIVKRASLGLARIWLVFASFYFYAYWNLSFLPVLLFSIVFNFVMAHVIARSKSRDSRFKPAALAMAIIGNLALLCYFKYLTFFADILGATLRTDLTALPLGISFFTFTQLTYLIDVAYKQEQERDPIRYSLFVNFFPHLIAGPILHHTQMIPQFDFKSPKESPIENVAIGLVIFTFGLFKKVALADNVQPFVELAFSKDAPNLFDAWTGVLAYTLQIYFDFSGYSDMAIGLARLFGIKFPMNFDSPYQAANIIDFWRRWHMTLSRFLRDYLYIPLGGNRAGLGQFPNIFITMFLGGLWHGAGWTFVIWGLMHATLLSINHVWRRIRYYYFGTAVPASQFETCAGWVLTFLAVTVTWVFFRANTLSQSAAIIGGMVGLNGTGSQSMSSCDGPLTCLTGIPTAWFWIGSLLTIVLFAPNVQQLMAPWNPTLDPVRGGSLLRLKFKPSLTWAIGLGIMLAISIVSLSSNSQFLYYQF